MRHAGPEALGRLASLLEAIRVTSAGRLKERSPGVFYLRSRAFLHFHEDPAGLHADLRRPGARDFARMRVEDADERAALLATVREALAG